jgi:inositol oxygenase
VSQQHKYGAFRHATMSVADAYEALMVLTGDSETPARSWLLHHVMATAEAARDDGHPDWFQLTLFLYVVLFSWRLVTGTLMMDVFV